MSSQNVKSEQLQKTLYLIIYFIAAIWLLVIFAGLGFVTAWSSDEARVAFISVEHAHSGAGPVFNIGERAQAYSHSLWFLVLYAGRFFWDNVAQIDYVLSAFFALGSYAALLFFAPHRSRVTLMFTLLILLSPSFVNYASSGLGSSLSYALVLVFVATVVARTAESKRLFLRGMLLSALLTLNGLEQAIMLAPVMVYLWLQLPNWRLRLQLPLIGASPLILWTVFSLFYYGVPFPNPVYAQWGSAVQATEVLTQRGHFSQAGVSFDTVAVILLIAGVIRIFDLGDHRHKACAAGTMLYLLFCVALGTDDTMHRYLAVPLLLVVALVHTLAPSENNSEPVYLLALLAALLLLPVAAWFLHIVIPSQDVEQFPNGIVDQQLYFPFGASPERGPNAEPDRKQPYAPYSAVKTVCGWHQLANSFEPGYFLVDKCGLTDPLLARLPPIERSNWQLGHMERPLPLGYLESIRSGTRVQDPQLQAYLSEARIIQAGDLWRADRLWAIFRNNVLVDPIADFKQDYHLDIDLLESDRQAQAPTISQSANEYTVVAFVDSISLGVVTAATGIRQLNVSFNPPGDYRVVLEYVDPDSYPAAGFARPLQKDYVIAVLRWEDRIEAGSQMLELPARDRREKLQAIHIMSDTGTNVTARLRLN